MSGEEERADSTDLEAWVQERLASARARQRATGREAYGRTWWGRAWVAALEQRARLDPNRLPRGRSYARHGRVGRLLAQPGEVRAPVTGSRKVAYRVRVRVRPFTGDEWDAALDAIAARAGHAAALLDGELSPEVTADLAGAGIDLLPGPGELATSCSCPDAAEPCKHAAAVCYLVADLLDDDPFTLLLLRGRTRAEVLAGLRARRGARRIPPEPREEGFPAAALAERAASLGPLPRPPLAPPHPGHPAPVAVDPPDGSGLATEDLLTLAADAAARAWQMAAGEGDGGLALDAEADLARRAAGAQGTPRLRQLALRSRVPERQLLRLAGAWEHGGQAALEVLGDAWEAPGEVMEEARAVVAGLLKGARVRIDGNRISGADVHLRYGRDGRWYRCERRGGGWDVVAPPSPDPASLVTS